MTTTVRPCAVMAISRNGVIGADGRLPWSVPEDLRMFRRLTHGGAVIMGRRTWESLDRRPLPGRANIVVTASASSNPPKVDNGLAFVRSPESALELASALDKQAFVIGGEQILRSFAPMIGAMHITMIDADFDGDAFFPFPFRFSADEPFQVVLENRILLESFSQVIRISPPAAYFFHLE